MTEQLVLDMPPRPPRLSDEELADIVAASREAIEFLGWTQHEFKDINGVCYIGAVLYSQDIDEEQCGNDYRVQMVAVALARALDILPHDPEECSRYGCSCVVNTITTWNDTQTTITSVLDAFAKAEKILRAGFDPDKGYRDE